MKSTAVYNVDLHLMQDIPIVHKAGVNVDQKGFCDIFGRTFVQLPTFRLEDDQDILRPYMSNPGGGSNV